MVKVIILSLVAGYAIEFFCCVMICAMGDANPVFAIVGPMHYWLATVIIAASSFPLLLLIARLRKNDVGTDKDKRGNTK
jgi:hypothetical protein